jgi:hypothetical protein
MPARTPYEAELRGRLEAAQRRELTYARLAVAQDAVVALTRRFCDGEIGLTVAGLCDALNTLDCERGKILIDTMPPELREAFTGPSAIEEALKVQTEPLFPGLTYPRKIAIVAVESSPDGEHSWHFDYADSVPEAVDAMRRWNERAAREWPDMRFKLETER